MADWPLDWGKLVEQTLPVCSALIFTCAQAAASLTRLFTVEPGHLDFLNVVYCLVMFSFPSQLVLFS